MPIQGKLEATIELKTNAEKYWGAIRELGTVFPKAFPNDIESIKIVEGDGKSAGSVYHIISRGELGSLFAKETTEKIDSIDDAKKTIVFDVSATDGKNVFKHVKKFKAHFNIIPKGDGSVLKWAAEYENTSEVDPEPTMLKEIEVQTLQELDAYMQKI